MSITVLNPAGFTELSKYTGNPFLDVMIDLEGVFNTLALYQKSKPYIDKYSDTSLSDLRDKIKANLPEVVNEDGSINFVKLEELANQGNAMAETILGIRNQREHFANATLGEKLATLYNPEKANAMTQVLSGALITKQAKVMKHLKDVEAAIKKLGLPQELETIFLANKEKIAGDPNMISALLNYFTLRQKQPNNNPDVNLTTDQQANNSFYQPQQIQSIEDIFNKQSEDIINKINEVISKTQKTKKVSTKKQDKLDTVLRKSKSTKSQQASSPLTKQTQQSLNSGIIFPWQNVNMPILPFEGLLPKTTKLW